MDLRRSSACFSPISELGVQGVTVAVEACDFYTGCFILGKVVFCDFGVIENFINGYVYRGQEASGVEFVT